MKKTLYDIVPTFAIALEQPLSMPGLVFILKHIVNYINEKPEGGAVIQAQHLLNIGRVKGQSAKQTKRERRRL